MNNEIYLGNGAYAKWDGLEIVIYTRNGDHPTNSVFIEPSAIKKLVEFLKEIVR